MCFGSAANDGGAGKLRRRTSLHAAIQLAQLLEIDLLHLGRNLESTQSIYKFHRKSDNFLGG